MTEWLSLEERLGSILHFPGRGLPSRRRRYRDYILGHLQAVQQETAWECADLAQRIWDKSEADRACDVADAIRHRFGLGDSDV